MKTKVSATIVGGLITVLSVAVMGEAASQEYTYIEIADCHIHLLDFLQNGDFYVNGKFIRGGTAAQALRPGQRIDALLQMMDHANVSQAMVSGMPFVKKWSAGDPERGGYYLDSDSYVVNARDSDYTIGEAILDYQRMAGHKSQMDRIHPFICAFDATDLGAVDRICKTIKAYPGIWKGIGEVMSRHDDLTNLTIGERPTAHHPALRRIYDFAGIHGLPVSLHHNVAPISPSGAFRKPLYLDELLVCFEGHPNTVFIWCHAGISRRIIVKDYTNILDTILAAHAKHVYIDLSWVVFEDYVLKDLPAWTDLIRKYPGNFMVGTDIVGGLRHYVACIRRYDKLFAALKDEPLAQKVASENFIRLMPETGITLPPDYLYPEENFVPK